MTDERGPAVEGTDARDGEAATFGPRSATIRSEVPHAATVAAALAPDDTDDVRTRHEDGAVVATIERETTGSLQATVDDYVVALDVASTVSRRADEIVAGETDATGAGTDGAGAADTGTDGTDADRTDPDRRPETHDTTDT